MSLFTIPTSITNHLKKIMRDFLWSNVETSTGLHWVNRRGLLFQAKWGHVLDLFAISMKPLIPNGVGVFENMRSMPNMGQIFWFGSTRKAPMLMRFCRLMIPEVLSPPRVSSKGFMMVRMALVVLHRPFGIPMLPQKRAFLLGLPACL